MTEREENNRILAAWVGWQYGICRDPDGQQCCGVDGSKHWHSPFTTDDWCPCGGNHGSGTNLPDFYTDETANAMLVDKILMLRNTNKRWFDKVDDKGCFNLSGSFRQLANLIDEVRPSYYTLDQMDRKAAICAAALLITRPQS